jgi:desampylase
VIVIKKKILEVAEASALEALPHEACGLLIGYGDKITELRICENVTTADPHKNFEIDPQMLIHAQKQDR